MDEVSKKIAEMEGKLGGDLQKMMGQLQNLSQRTQALDGIQQKMNRS